MTANPVDGRLQFDQLLWDDQGDEIEVLDVHISHFDDVAVQPFFARPSWLTEGYTLTSAIIGGKRKATIHFNLEHAEMNLGKYTIAVVFTDSKTEPQECSFNLYNMVEAPEPV